MRSGFTLIEMLAVVVVLALLGTMAGVSLRGAAARASLDEIVDRVAAYDAGARTYAARYGRPVVLQWTDRGVSQRLAEAEDDLTPREPLHLPGRYRLSVVGAEQEETVEAPISTAGASPTYVVRVTAAEGRSRWVLFAGLTGEVTRLDDEAGVEALLAILHDGADDEESDG